jgi:NADH:ubiquinone oxidoreductase subunit K
MTNKQRALLKVAKMVGFGAAVGSVVTLSQIYFGIAETALGLAVLIMIYLGKTAYDMEVDRLNTLDKLNQR